MRRIPKFLSKNAVVSEASVEQRGPSPPLTDSTESEAEEWEAIVLGDGGDAFQKVEGLTDKETYTKRKRRVLWDEDKDKMTMLPAVVLEKQIGRIAENDVLLADSDWRKKTQDFLTDTVAEVHGWWMGLRRRRALKRYLKKDAQRCKNKSDFDWERAKSEESKYAWIRQLKFTNEIEWPRKTSEVPRRSTCYRELADVNVTREQRWQLANVIYFIFQNSLDRMWATDDDRRLAEDAMADLVRLEMDLHPESGWSELLEISDTLPRAVSSLFRLRRLVKSTKREQRKERRILANQANAAMGSLAIKATWPRITNSTELVRLMNEITKLHKACIKKRSRSASDQERVNKLWKMLSDLPAPGYPDLEPSSKALLGRRAVHMMSEINKLPETKNELTCTMPSQEEQLVGFLKKLHEAGCRRGASTIDEVLFLRWITANKENLSWSLACDDLAWKVELGISRNTPEQQLCREQALIDAFRGKQPHSELDESGSFVPLEGDEIFFLKMTFRIWSRVRSRGFCTKADMCAFRECFKSLFAEVQASNQAANVANESVFLHWAEMVQHKVKALFENDANATEELAATEEKCLQTSWEYRCIWVLANMLERARKIEATGKVTASHLAELDSDLDYIIAEDSIKRSGGSPSEWLYCRSAMHCLSKARKRARRAEAIKNVTNAKEKEVCEETASPLSEGETRMSLLARGCLDGRAAFHRELERLIGTVSLIEQACDAKASVTQIELLTVSYLLQRLGEVESKAISLFGPRWWEDGKEKALLFAEGVDRPVQDLLRLSDKNPSVISSPEDSGYGKIFLSHELNQ